MSVGCAGETAQLVSSRKDPSQRKTSLSVRSSFNFSWTFVRINGIQTRLDFILNLIRTLNRIHNRGD